MLLLFNKPYDVLSQFTDQSNRQTLHNFITIKGIYPAGRLDRDSEGLLILTDDGRLQHLISDPRHKLEKTYWVQVEGIPTNIALDKLRAGISLNDGPCAAAKVQPIEEPKIWPRTPPIRKRANIPTAWLEISISEGRNRQVRRMTAAIGYPTLRLIRLRIGPWQLGKLQPGEYLELHPAAEDLPPKWRKILEMPVAPNKPAKSHAHAQRRKKSPKLSK